MSRYHYSFESNQSFTIRGTAKLLNVSSARYGGDWHSVPHTHNHTELFFIVSGKGQFPFLPVGQRPVNGRGNKGHIVAGDAGKIFVMQTTVDAVRNSLHGGEIVAHKFSPM